MQQVLIAIRDCGDGSQTLDWFRGVDEQKLRDNLERDPYDSYQSGDGVQIDVIEFPDDFDLDKIKGVYWNSLDDN